jgi:hypothetical protein
MTYIVENLHAGDLKGLVKKTFEIDSYKSKIGDDEDIIVLSFVVESENPAKDLENFIEMGYDFVIDSDLSQGETDDGTFRVYVELERSSHAPAQIMELLKGITLLTDLPNMRFRYYKSFKSQEASLETLTDTIALDANAYHLAIQNGMLENFTNFFGNSFVHNISILDESITFTTKGREPLRFNIITSGPIKSVYDAIPGPILIECSDIADVLHLTKYIGNYNITKIGTSYIFETDHYAVALEKS